MPDEVPAYIAARLDSNIRELEGALTRLRGLAMANGVPITLELAKQALADGRPAEAAGAATQPTIQQIIDAVTKYYDIKLSDLMSKRRHKSVNRAARTPNTAVMTPVVRVGHRAIALTHHAQTSVPNGATMRRVPVVIPPMPVQNSILTIAQRCCRHCG